MEESSSAPHPDSDSHDDQILRLLDAVDELLYLQSDLAQKLSRGWIDIASARYSMGPSRISQSLFSLKPCTSTALVSVTPEAEGADENDICSHFSFRIQKTDVGDTITASDGDKTSSPTSLFGLRHRHAPGLAGRKTLTIANETTIIEESRKTKNVKQPSESIAWFGILVSPHLRTAQLSFTEALETLVELATLQSTILATIEKLKGAGLI